jgi:hypothetical protein
MNIDELKIKISLGIGGEVGLFVSLISLRFTFWLFCVHKKRKKNMIKTKS